MQIEEVHLEDKNIYSILSSKIVCLIWFNLVNLLSSICHLSLSVDCHANYMFWPVGVTID